MRRATAQLPVPGRAGSETICAAACASIPRIFLFYQPDQGNNEIYRQYIRFIDCTCGYQFKLITMIYMQNPGTSRLVSTGCGEL
jgi:hypothetical protein